METTKPSRASEPHAVAAATVGSVGIRPLSSAATPAGDSGALDAGDYVFAPGDTGDRAEPDAAFFMRCDGSGIAGRRSIQLSYGRVVGSDTSPVDACQAESWKPIAGVPGYEVSDLGRVRHGARVLRTRVDPYDGYRKISLRPTSRHGKSKNFRVHLLVARAFKGPTPRGYLVDHRDGDKGNAQLGNLEIVTCAENTRRAIRGGLQSLARGERNGQSRLLEIDIPAIRRRRKLGWTLAKIAERHACSATTIARVLRGKTWGHVADHVARRSDYGRTIDHSLPATRPEDRRFAGMRP